MDENQKLDFPPPSFDSGYFTAIYIYICILHIAYTLCMANGGEGWFFREESIECVMIVNMNELSWSVESVDIF